MELLGSTLHSQEHNYNAAQKEYKELCEKGEYSKALREQDRMHSIVVFMHRCGYYLDQDPFTSEFIFTPEGH